jgi:hypothetical protein
MERPTAHYLGGSAMTGLFFSLYLTSSDFLVHVTFKYRQIGPSGERALPWALLWNEVSTINGVFFFSLSLSF